jgi:hypothetical protein
VVVLGFNPFTLEERKRGCCNQLSISDKILSKAIKKKLLLNGFYYKEIGDKINML